MRRRNFLASTFSSLASYQFLTWAFGKNLGTPPAKQSRGTKPSELAIIYNPAQSAEEAAAGELRDFLARMTGVTPHVVEGSDRDEIPDHTVHFLVGRTPAVSSMISRGEIEDPAKTNPEAYSVRSLAGGGGGQVVFLGGTGIATLYAVYHFLEKHCGVGFFWDGDRVPRRELVPTGSIDISAVPRFNERMCMNLTLYWYSAPWWEWDDWQAYIDWTLKSRFNILSLWDTPGEDVAWRKAWKKVGVEIADDSYSGPPYEIFAPIKYGVRPPLSAGWREGQSELNRKIIQYARARGMRSLVPAIPGIVPPELASAPSDARTFEISWAGLPKQKYLHPSTPLYHQVGKTFLEEYVSLYGTDHLYWLENYLECDIQGPDDLQQEVRREIAGANFQVVNELDPKGVGILSAWSYLFKPSLWTPELVKEHLERVPADRIRVLDQWAEMVPEHKRLDYFFGRPWYFGVVHSFGGDTNLHGHMALLEKQFHEVVNDKRARRCVGFSPTEETIHHNYVYYNFLVKLGWNPSEVELGSFLRDYAVLRYGEGAAQPMGAALRQLLSSVYSSDDLTQPLYWHRLGAESAYFKLNVVQRTAFIPHLRQALEMALQSKTPGESPLYLHDLNDIARQYLAELFNAHVMNLQKAHAALDPASFTREVDLLEQIMGSVEALLSHDDYYWLSPFIRKAQRLPGAPQDVAHRARDIFTLWAGVIRDYACRDYYELVQGYYRPRVRVYLQNVREAFNFGQRMVYNQVKLESEYDAIEKKWVDDGFPLLEQRPDPKRVISTVEEILVKFRSAENVSS